MEPVTRNIIATDWITILIFLSLLFVVLAKSVFYARFLNFIILPFNNKYIFMYNKKERLINWFNLFLGFFLIINFSLFIYLGMNVLFETIQISDVIVFPLIMGLVGAFSIRQISASTGQWLHFWNTKDNNRGDFQEIVLFQL